MRKFSGLLRNLPNYLNPPFVCQIQQFSPFNEAINLPNSSESLLNTTLCHGTPYILAPHQFPPSDFGQQNLSNHINSLIPPFLQLWPILKPPPAQSDKDSPTNYCPINKRPRRGGGVEINEVLRPERRFQKAKDDPTDTAHQREGHVNEVSKGLAWTDSGVPFISNGARSWMAIPGWGQIVLKLTSNWEGFGWGHRSCGNLRLCRRIADFVGFF